MPCLSYMTLDVGVLLSWCAITDIAFFYDVHDEESARTLRGPVVDGEK